MIVIPNNKRRRMPIVLGSSRSSPKILVLQYHFTSQHGHLIYIIAPLGEYDQTSEQSLAVHVKVSMV
jgi:hypothetical protein